MAERTIFTCLQESKNKNLTNSYLSLGEQQSEMEKPLIKSYMRMTIYIF